MGDGVVKDDNRLKWGSISRPWAKHVWRARDRWKNLVKGDDTSFNDEWVCSVKCALKSMRWWVVMTSCDDERVNSAKCTLVSVQRWVTMMSCEELHGGSKNWKSENRLRMKRHMWWVYKVSKNRWVSESMWVASWVNRHDSSYFIKQFYGRPG